MFVGLVFIVSGLLILSLRLAPFPYWSVYFCIWKAILSDPEPIMDVQGRLRQVTFLLRFVIRISFLSFFWLLDELMFFGYRKVAIQRPVFLVCQPRSGSTFLHRTLASDKRFLATRFIEWHYPSIVLQKLRNLSVPILRKSHRSYLKGNEHMKIAEKMHSSLIDDYEEDDCLFDEAFYCNYFVATRHPFPNLFNKLTDFESLPVKVQQRMLLAHRKVTQKMLYIHGTNRIYLAKITESHLMLPAFSKLYPDARFITQTRDAYHFMNSLDTLNGHLTFDRIGVDLHHIPEWQQAHLSYRLRVAKRHIDFFKQLPDTEKLCLSYDHFVNQIPGTIKLIYQWLGIAWTEQVEQSLNDLQEQQKRRKRGYDVGDRYFPEFQFFDDFAAKNAAHHQGLLANLARQ
jgi:hypothetical protein